jgi:hypothetical protein
MLEPYLGLNDRFEYFVWLCDALCCNHEVCLEWIIVECKYMFDCFSMRLLILCAYSVVIAFCYPFLIQNWYTPHVCFWGCRHTVFVAVRWSSYVRLVSVIFCLWLGWPTFGGSSSCSFRSVSFLAGAGVDEADLLGFAALLLFMSPWPWPPAAHG